ncbi:hypothetical protein [Streptomyces yangpuensis]|uniref:hypothetical protein n=1 Tax=Streptomyces yangpuensis TaxID=1648182 RepID=UPI0035DB5971
MTGRQRRAGGSVLVGLGLATAGFHVAPPQPLTDEEQGGVAAYIDDGQVVVDWLPHARLNRAALATAVAGADGTHGTDGVRYWAVRRAMDTALGTILAGFRYPTRSRPDSRFGHIIEQAPTTPDV